MPKKPVNPANPLEANLRNRLWKSAELAALRHGMRFRAQCKAHVMNFIDIGVAEIINNGAQDDIIRTRLAEYSIDALVEEMVATAKDQNLKALEEQTFFYASNLLCPLWPFC